MTEEVKPQEQPAPKAEKTKAQAKDKQPAAPVTSTENGKRVVTLPSGLKVTYN